MRTLSAFFACILTCVPAFSATVADSADDWSTEGEQGVRNWFHGFYDLTNDADGIYSVEDFQAFENLAGPDGGPASPDGNHWSGDEWRLIDAPILTRGPWTRASRAIVSPNAATSTPDAEHWVVRRWVADADYGALALTWTLAKDVARGGGVTGRLFLDGIQMDSEVIAGDDTAGITRTIIVRNVSEGAIVDLAITPVGSRGSRDDIGDASAASIIIDDDPKCFELLRAEAECLPDGSLHVTIDIRNDSDFTADRIFFWAPSGVDISPGELFFSALLPQASTGPIDFLIIGAVPPSVCLFVSLHESSTGRCCGGEICVDIPNCGGGGDDVLFRRGDANDDGRADLSDGIVILSFLFRGFATPTCLDAADVNDSGAVDISDAISIFGFLFLGGARPPSPGVLDCGPDPTTDDPLDCIAYTSC